MQIAWEPILSMERIVEQAVACGIVEEDLRFARLAVEMARLKTPTTAEESIELWHKVVAHGEVNRLPINACSQFIAAMAWREAHIALLGETIVRRRWWRREDAELVVETKAWQ
jgi:hypothetical protein